jgi:asparagine synthase (glutamine-hydrolysing)
MVGALAHRGPDGEGIESWPSAVLGHRRLAIFDLSGAGRQPMLTPDRRTGVVFNGAIYNFRDLRQQLERRGAVFRSQTDTEILLAGYREWGIDGLLDRVRGMYAFCLWDDDARTAWLVRDRLGVKPLVYMEHGGALAFASTVRALARAKLVGGLSDDAIARALEFGFVPDSASAYEGVRKVPPGCLLEWRCGEPSSTPLAKLRRYWRQPRIEDSGLSFDEAVEETERLLLQAVKRRLDADVPVAALLSGGIDSALVCWAMRELGADIQTFTMATPNDPGDEAGDARRTAASLGLRHNVLTLDGQAVPTVQELADAYAEPFPCSSAFGMLRLARAIKREATVVLTGDGGDDVFLGYDGHRNFWRAELLARALPSMVGVAWSRVREPQSVYRGPAAGRVARAMRFADYATGGLGAVQSAHDSRWYFGRTGVLGERLRHGAVWARPERWSPGAARWLLQDYLDFTLENRFSGEYLTKVDGGAMWYALEARSPFLDQDLWEFAARLPAQVRLRGGEQKAVLRSIARRRIGKEMSRLDKRGFSVPAERWLVTAWRDEFEANLADLRLARLGYLDGVAVRKAWQEALRMPQAPRQLWYVHAVETWLRHEERAA